MLDISVGDERHYIVKNKISDWNEEWTFKGFNTGTYTHKIHKYPAMFIPQVVRKIIAEYTEVGDTVLDIFNGSGSTTIEALVTGRNAIGIEINPLANLIAKVKTTSIDYNTLMSEYEKLKINFFDNGFSFSIAEFDNIDFWFTSSVVNGLSKLKNSIKKIENIDVSNFFLVCMSENIRELSVCRHSGFKMHRDPNKVDKQYTHDEIFDLFTKSYLKNSIAVKKFTEASKNFDTTKRMLQSSSTDRQDISNVDLIITSPPYGDSSTTVAYGQFSRLSSQWLDLELDGLTNIASLDRHLLGGKSTNSEEIENVCKKSATLNSAIMYYNSLLADESLSDAEKKKLFNRINDVASFYVDLDKCISNASVYLKHGKNFVLVTGSRVVKLYKLHTDIICAELAENYGFVLSAIFYRNIENKRMPNMVSATNIVGEKAPTMTKESIVVLKKIS